VGEGWCWAPTFKGLATFGGGGGGVSLLSKSINGHNFLTLLSDGPYFRGVVTILSEVYGMCIDNHSYDSFSWLTGIVVYLNVKVKLPPSPSNAMLNLKRNCLQQTCSTFWLWGEAGQVKLHSRATVCLRCEKVSQVQICPKILSIIVEWII